MDLNQLALKIQFGKKEQVAILTQLSYLVDAGVPAPDALRHMRLTYKEKRNKVLYEVINQMANNASEGERISEDMEKWFPYEVCKILSTSEERGILEEGIHNSIDFLQSGKKFFAPLSKMLAGIIYVVALLVAIAVIGTIFLPQIGQYVKDWPTISIYFKSFANILYYYFPVILLAMAGYVLWTLNAIKHYSGRIDQWVALPFMKIYKAKSGYSILKTLSLLSKNGVGVPEIIFMLTSQYKSGMVSEKIKIMYDRIRSGEQNMGEVMDTGLFTPMQISELNLISQFVGEEDYSKIFDVMSKIISKNIVNSVKQFAVIVNTVCLFLTGAGILWVYGAYAVLASSIN